MAVRYVAGEDAEAAIAVVRRLADEGCAATLDVLGEDVEGEERALQAVEDYCCLLDPLNRAEAEVDAGISIKLSQLGVRLFAELALTNLERVVERAGTAGRRVRIDMEDSSLTSVTLKIYRTLVARFSNVGVVLQAYMRRSVDDLRDLLPLRPDVRIGKGIYRESPAIALTDEGEIRENFLRLVDLLLENAGRAAIATHDESLVDAALARFSSLIPEERAQHEFQMLLGVGGSLRQKIQAAGMRVRVYVPFGSSWYAYSLRRLRENPTIAGYVLKDFLARRR